MSDFIPHTGQLKHPFTFKNVDKTGNTSGGKGELYSEFYSTRGYFRQVSGSTLLEEGRYIRVTTYEAYCFWRSALEAELTNDTRLVYDGKEFRIDNHERIEEDRRFYKFDLSAANV